MRPTPTFTNPRLRIALWVLLWASSLWGCSTPATIQVRFSPHGQCTQLIEETLAQARKLVLVQAYSFTAVPIANALIAAHER